MTSAQHLTTGIDTRIVVVRGTGTGPAVVVFPSGFGVTDDLQGQMAQLAQDARVVVAVDVFGRSGAGPGDYADTAAVMKRLQGFDREQGTRDWHAAIAFARLASPDAVVAVGICFGGVFALLAAADGLVDAVATWHAGRVEQILGRAAEMRVPLRLHFGAVDPIVPMSAVDAIAAAFADRDDVVVVVHAGATHGFSHPTAAAFNAPAEAAAMNAVRDLIALTSIAT